MPIKEEEDQVKYVSDVSKWYVENYEALQTETEASQVFSLACLIYAMAKGITCEMRYKKSGEGTLRNKNPFLLQLKFKKTDLT